MELFDELKRRAEPLMQGFQSDLEHDRRWIEDNPGREFIHVTRATGTHILLIPDAEALLDDAPVPHLFGEARPSEVFRQLREFMTGGLRQSAKLWLLWDGKRLRRSSADACLSAFDRGLRAAERRARRRAA